MSALRYVVDDIPRRRFLEVGLKGGLAVAITPAFVERLFAAGAPGALQPATAPADRAMLDRVIRRALENGGDFADVYLETRTTRNILMEESKFRSAEFGISQGAGVRVLLRRQDGLRLHGRTHGGQAAPRGRGRLVRRTRGPGCEAGQHSRRTARFVRHRQAPARAGGRREATRHLSPGRSGGARLRQADQDGQRGLLRRGAWPDHREQRRRLP